MIILKMSISAAILGVVVVIVRALAMHKLPKRTFVLLWGVVLMRLLLPLSLALPIGVPFDANTVADALAGKAIPPDGSPMVGDSAVDAIAGDMQPPANPATPEHAVRLTPAVLAWLVGMTVGAAFFLATHLRCRREYKTALPLESGFVAGWLREHRLRRVIQVRYSDRIDAPMTYGIWKPVILLPKATDWRDEARLRHVLAHEFTHIRWFDVLLKCLLAAAVCVHWFNPLVWVVYVLANRDIEMSCDEAVVRAFGEGERSTYALTLLCLEEKRGGLSPLCNNFAKNAIEERIYAIMKTKRPPLVRTLLAVVLVAALAAGALVAFAADGGDDEGIRLPLSDGKSATDADTEAAVAGDDESPTRPPMPDAEFAIDANDEVIYSGEADPAILAELEEIMKPQPRQDEFTEDGLDTSNAIFMPTTLLSVKQSDEDKFTQQEWSGILDKIENGEMFWEA
uniref:Antirepressor n=1 Tax=uncultured bacterium contig00005 TaxID=1181497 RepID=A0A806KD34_9BACT|nr:antirepressor [uncultured bacterium contig00005]